MKKYFIAAMTLVMTVFASCSNEELFVDNNDVKVNFTVADKEGVGSETRAVKSGWAAGDEILIVFEGGEGWLNCANSTNTLKLIKTAEGWDTDKTHFPELSNLANGKKFFAVHHPGTIELGEQSGSVAYISSYTNGHEYIHYQGTYTISGNEISLGQIVMKRPHSFQISVKINTSYTGDWTMQLLNPDQFGMDQCYTHLYMLLSGEVQISGTSIAEANAVTIGTDKVFTFTGRNSDKVAQWIRVNKNDGTFYYNGTFYYKLDTAKTMAELTNKAWTLPELTINDSNEIEGSTGWSKNIE